MALWLGSGQVLQYLRAAPSELDTSNRVYRAARAALSACVPDNAVTVLGGLGYFYLYDVRYVSTMRLVAEQFLHPPERTDFASLIDHYRDMPGKNYRKAPFPKDERRAALVRHAEVLVAGDNPTGWEWFFYDPDVWMPDFVEKASVFFPPNDRATLSMWPTPQFTVFIRRNMDQRKSDRSTAVGEPDRRLIRVGGEAVVAVHAPGVKMRTRIDTIEWLAMEDAARREALERHFEEQRWYGAELDESEQRALVNQLLPRVHYFLIRWANSQYNGISINRTLGQAVDLTFAADGVPKVFLDVAREAPVGSDATIADGLCQ